VETDRCTERPAPARTDPCADLGILGLVSITRNRLAGALVRAGLLALGSLLLLAASSFAAQAGILRLRSDFFYYWVAGWMLLSGISPHDPDAWPTVYRDLTGAVSVDHAFPYPPWTVLPVLPLALLDPAWAATLWLAASLGALGAAALSVLRDVPPDRHLHATGIGALALAGFAPLVEALFFGQLSPLLAAALLGACALARSSRQNLAAALPAALLLKPQLGLVVLPATFLYLLCRGNRRATAALCLSCLGIVLLSAPWIPAWILYLEASLRTNAVDAARTPTVYGFALLLERSVGAVAAAAAVLLLAIAVLGPLAALFRQPSRGGGGLASILRGAIPASLVITPYLWTYDLSLLLACMLPACRDLLAKPGRTALVSAWALAAGSAALSWLLVVLVAVYRCETPSLALPVFFAAVAWPAVFRRSEGPPELPAPGRAA
jgi:hypothetical protein